MQLKSILYALATAGCLAATLPANAAEKIKAVVIDGYPAKAMWVKEFTGFFIPEVDKRLAEKGNYEICLLYTSPSPRDATLSRMPSSA